MTEVKSKNVSNPNIERAIEFQEPDAIRTSELCSKLLDPESGLSIECELIRHGLLTNPKSPFREAGRIYHPQRMPFHIELCQGWKPNLTDEDRIAIAIKVLARVQELQGKIVHPFRVKVTKKAAVVECPAVTEYGPTHITLAFFPDGAPTQEEMDQAMAEIFNPSKFILKKLSSSEEKTIRMNSGVSSSSSSTTPPEPCLGGRFREFPDSRMIIQCNCEFPCTSQAWNKKGLKKEEGADVPYYYRHEMWFNLDDMMKAKVPTDKTIVNERGYLEMETTDAFPSERLTNPSSPKKPKTESERKEEPKVVVLGLAADNDHSKVYVVPLSKWTGKMEQLCDRMDINEAWLNEVQEALAPFQHEKDDVVYHTRIEGCIRKFHVISLCP